MTQDTISLRKATTEDALTLAQLINFAGEGIPLKLWETMAENGETAWEVGQRRALREEGGFSYRNATIATNDNQSLAGLIGYAIGSTPEEITPDTPPTFVPLLELENEALSTWYVNVLAAYPEFRGKGLGSRLLREAEQIALNDNVRKMSIIVSDANIGAKRLYERTGYQYQSARPMVKGDWVGEGENWLLLTKSL